MSDDIKDTKDMKPVFDAILGSNQEQTNNTPSPARAHEYPSVPIWNDAIKYKKGVIAALREFKASYPFSVGYDKRKEGMLELVTKLNTIYEMSVSVSFSKVDDEGNDCMDNSLKSNYNDLDDTINMIGKLSIITLLHEFAHAKGLDEHGAVVWSITLFKRVYHIAFTKLVADAHLLREQSAPSQDELLEVNNG